MKPRLLDLFCGAGGAAEGYHRAGFTIVGVDKDPQPTYPFPFIQADAMQILADRDYVESFDAVHASPICQAWCRVTEWRGSRSDHPDLLTPTLTALRAMTVPWVVENAPEAAWYGPLRADYLLCGTAFGLRVRRHRAFECGNWPAFSLAAPCQCYRNPDLIPFEHKDERAFADAMGCTWMSNKAARQAIPPAYTEHIGAQLLAHVMAVAS